MLKLKDVIFDFFGFQKSIYALRISNNRTIIYIGFFFNITAEEDVIINFFKWLNVNQYTKFETIKKSLGRWEHDEYSKIILSLHKEQRTDVFKNYAVKVKIFIERVVVCC